jgi:endonuclease YncB( thermonuclease family)
MISKYVIIVLLIIERRQIMRKLFIPIILFVLLLSACSKEILLPDLSNLTEAEAIAVLEDQEINYEVNYEFDITITHGNFIRYEIGFVPGKKIQEDEVIKIYIANNGLALPEVTNKTINEVKEELDALNIEYVLAYENNFLKDDLEFSRYLDYLTGDILVTGNIVTVYITWNGSLLPDLTNKLQREIIQSLEYDFITNYEFEYIENDEFEQDMFAGYKDLNIGDPAPENETLTVYLYKNSFTDAEDQTIFISKYLSGTGNNRAIEIYNPTDANVNLDDYHIALFMNGSYTMNHRIQLAGLLSPGETYTLVYRGSTQNLRDLADQDSAVLLFDGNDTVQLRYKNNTYIDTIYDLGNELFVMYNELFIRNESVQKGNRTFNLSEWDAYVPTYIETFGTHPIAKPEAITINLSYLNNSWGSPTVSGMVLVTVPYINDGDTAWFSPGFEGDSRMRFLGVDTPETHPVEEPWGPEAKVFTTNVLTQPGATIYVQSDPFLGAVETYGRSLGYVWVNGSLLNLEIIRNGYSYNYLSSNTKLVYNNRYIYRWFQDAEKYARDNSLGIHS